MQPMRSSRFHLSLTSASSPLVLGKYLSDQSAIGKLGISFLSRVTPMGMP